MQIPTLKKLIHILRVLVVPALFVGSVVTGTLAAERAESNSFQITSATSPQAGKSSISQAKPTLPMLQYGDSGQAVVNLQNQLKRANCLPQEFEATRSYDNDIRGAVMNLQMHSNLPINGIADTKTYAALAANQKCKELTLGSRGEAVRQMQIQLSNWDFPHTGQRLKLTGVFDTETQKAWQEFKEYFPTGNPYINLWKPRVVALVENLENRTFSWIAPALENLNPSEKPQAVSMILSIMESSGSYSEYGLEVPNSAAALGILKADATTAVPKLLELLRNPQNHPFVRAQAAKALGYIGADANQAIPALIAVATSKNDGNALESEAIVPQMKPIPPLPNETMNSDVLRSEAIEALGWFGAEAKDAIQPLLGILNDPTAGDNFRKEAAQALAYIGAEFKQAVPALINAVEPLLKILNDPTKDEEFRAEAARALGDIGAEPNRVVSGLINIAKNRKAADSVRYRAIEAIGVFVARANAPVERLLEILNDPTESVNIRQQVVATLGKVGPEARSVVTTLIGLLDDQNYPTLGLENRFQGKTLDAELKSIKVDFGAGTDAPATLREEASLALANIGSAAIPELIAALQSPDEKVRYSAAFALGQMQSPAPAAVEPLKAIMSNPKENSNIRWMAASTLEKMGQDTQTFFSQSPRPSFATLEKQVCISPPESPDGHTMVFNKYAGRCVLVEGRGAGGGKQVAARLLRGRK